MENKYESTLTNQVPAAPKPSIWEALNDAINVRIYIFSNFLL